MRLSTSRCHRSPAGTSATGRMWWVMRSRSTIVTGARCSRSRRTTTCSPCSSPGRSRSCDGACGHRAPVPRGGGRLAGARKRVRAGRRADRFYGATDLRNFLRKPYGPGWALVGDAGCHKDPYLALGICDAFRDAELLSDAIDDGLAGRRDIEDALVEYERRRNEATMPDYRLNLERARFTPIPEQRRCAPRFTGTPRRRASST